MANSKLMLAAITGLAVGIGVGMLIAPVKGSKTRKRLKKRIMGIADMVQDDLAEKLNAFKSSFAPDENVDIPDGERVTEEVKEAK